MISTAPLRRLLAALAVIPLLVPAAARPALAAPAADGRDLTAYANPLMGSVGPGFPMVGAQLPFGMIEPGPDTGHPGTSDPVNYDGYAYQDTMIRGFSLAHFDGAGIPIGGDLPFMPTTGAVTSSDPLQYQSAYTHTAETAEPGFYSVALARYGTSVALSAAERSAIMRYTFPAGGQANVLAHPGLNIKGTHPASVRVRDAHTLEGWMRSETRATDGYTLYFSAVFDQAFAATGTWTGAGGTPSPGTTATGDGAGAYLTFAPGQVVTMRVGISYVDLAGARNNRQSEIPGTRTLENVRQAAHETWNAHLHGIEVETTGNSALELERLKAFYSSLYKA
ncbi:MAG: glycoside hydrolase family 92 protein, partial [Candidatus Dormibacteraeota bacterium]|nr:glycoside hydrolase family 92 protein [Candidatus Dormibacteraeota bacterium]